MNLEVLESAASKFQASLFQAIRTARYDGRTYDNGQKAKEALIRSQSLIMNFHDAVKESLLDALRIRNRETWSVHPPLGQRGPELKIHGLIKAKNQDLVFLAHDREPVTIDLGPNKGQSDEVGLKATRSSIVVGVRSQMSSVNKNFDTLMERTFAETLNLRLRTPEIVMGEVYVLPIKELDDQAMLRNQVASKGKVIDLGRFIRTFDSFTHRSSTVMEQQYKYDATALVVLDLMADPVRVLKSGGELQEYGLPKSVADQFHRFSPVGFDDRLIASYDAIHGDHERFGS